MPFALFALAAMAFAIGTSEFAIMGLLPQVAHGVDVSIPSAGVLITGYAIGVIVGAPLLTAAATRLSHKATLLLVAALLITGSVLSALAPSYGLLLAARVLAGAPQGALFGVGSVVAADLVPPERRPQAMSIMFGGFTLANVLGVPLGTLVGHALGWRATFWGITLLGLASLVAIVALLPERPRRHETGLRGELAVLRRPQVWLAMAVTTVGFGGVFASFTYVTPMMTKVAGFAGSSITPLLVIFGLGMTAGNMLSGRYAGRRLMPSLYVFLAGLTVVLALFTATAHVKILAACTLFLLGMFGFATVPALQMRILDQATGAPTLASTLNLSAFNVANAVGAFLGGEVIKAGFGFAAPNAVGALMAAGGLVLALISGTLDKRASQEDGVPERDAPPRADPGGAQRHDEATVD